MRHLMITAMAIVVLPMVALPMTGCSVTDNRNVPPLPSIMQQFDRPYFVNAQQIIVENRYDPLANAKDVSSTFPTPPDIAIKRYAETRLHHAGAQGTLRFVIHDASVFKDDMDSEVEVARWLGADRRTRYTAHIRIGLYRDTDSVASGIGAPGAELRAERTLTVPSGLSLDDRDHRVQAFLVQLLADVDNAVTDSLDNTLRLSAPEPSPSPGPWPAPPVEILPWDMAN